MCSVRSHIFFLCCCPPSHTTVNTTNVALETEPETLLEAAHLGVSGPLWGPGAPCSPAACAQAAKLFSASGYHSNAQHVPKQDASGLIQPQGVDIMAAMIYPARRKAELKKGCQQQSRAPAKSEEETLCVLCLWFIRRTLSIEGTGQSRSAWPMKSAAKATVATGGGLGFSNCRRKERRSIFYEKKIKQSLCWSMDCFLLGCQLLDCTSKGEVYVISYCRVDKLYIHWFILTHDFLP